MNVAPAATPVKPQPVPGAKPGTIDPEVNVWRGRQVADIALTRTDQAGKVTAFTDRFEIGRVYHSASFPNKQLNQLVKALATTRTLDRAVTIASKFAEEARNVSVGLMQAASGAYYLTNLYERRGWNSYANIDRHTESTGFWGGKPHLIEATSATALVPELKAIVGKRTWFNFTDQEIDPKLAG